MLWTLQRYIFREMGRTFLLTAIGLIGLLGLGGGVLNMIELEGVTALQLFKLMALILPVSAALTLPIAALYSATVTYGRLSADNELTACRSGGINILWLLLPTLVFSLVSAACSFFFINFLIPGMVMNIDRLVGADLPRLVAQRLASPERLNLNNDKYQIFADRYQVRDVPASEDQPRRTQLELAGVAFMEMGKQRWTRFGTAERVVIAFDTQEVRATLQANMYDLTMFDYDRGWFNEAHFPIGRYQLPRTVPLKVKWLKLGDLIQYRMHPLLFPEIERRVDQLRAQLARRYYYDTLKFQWQQSAEKLRRGYGEVIIGTPQLGYTVRSARLQPDEEDGHPIFLDNVEIIESRDGKVARTVNCQSAVLQADREGDGGTAVYLQALGDVAIVDAREPDLVVRRDRERFAPVPLMPESIRRAKSVSAEALLEQQAESLGLPPDAEKARKKLLIEVGELTREIIGVLHSRLAFSLSVFVLVILGAALGIVFRGAHTLTAFGISFVPSLFVICTIIMGKQLVQNPTTVGAGVALIWAGIAIVAGVDAFVLTRVLRR